MSHRLDEQIDYEIERLKELLLESRSLVDSSSEAASDATKRWALAAVLHAFYNGVENILKRIAIAYDGRPGKGNRWHIELLVQMSKATSKRPAVISDQLLSLLRGYLAFRHLFRSIYTQDLRWESMAELVEGVDGAFAKFQGELMCFRKHLPEQDR